MLQVMREEHRSEYGARLLSARKAAGLTQVALAKAVGMSQSSYAEAETTGNGSAYTAQIAAACGVSAEWLATGKGARIAGQGEHPRGKQADIWRRVANEAARQLGDRPVNVSAFLSFVDLMSTAISADSSDGDISAATQQHLRLVA